MKSKISQSFAGSAEQQRAAPDDKDLLALVYKQLHTHARRLMAREREGQTLQATALVHEAYLRLEHEQKSDWEGARLYCAAAAQAMRRILLDRARRKRRIKRGGDLRRVSFDDIDPIVEDSFEEILAVDEILAKLERVDPKARKIVDLRFFAGFTVRETAEILGISVTTVESKWRFVRAWVTERLGRDCA